MVNAVYFPILKMHQGECDAVAHLSPWARALTRPLFDMPRPTEERRRELASFLCDSATRLVRSWGVRHSFLADFSLYAPDESMADGSHPVTHYFACLRQLGALGVPVAGPESVRGPGNRYLEAVSGIAKIDGRGIALRLPPEDVLRPDKISAVVADTLNVLEMSSEVVDLVIDVESLIRLPHGADSESAVTALLFEALSAIESFRFRDVVVCGSSLPEPLSKRNDWRPAVVPRVEFSAWQRLLKQFGNRIKFGDYGIVFPLEADSGPVSRPPARVRLSNEKEHVIVRAPPEEYGKLCDWLFNERFVPADPVCWGLTELSRCRGRRDGVGNATNWIARDTNLHLEGMVRSLCAVLGMEERDLVEQIPNMDRMPWHQDPLELYDEA